MEQKHSGTVEPISLLSHKLFARVITNRLAVKFDDFRPPEQAGFRKGYSTIDHIHTVRQIIQKSEKIINPCVVPPVSVVSPLEIVSEYVYLGETIQLSTNNFEEANR